MQKEIEVSSVQVDEKLNKDLVQIFQDTTDTNIPDFMKFFWQEQQKYIVAKSRSNKQVTYHPQIIKYCLAIHAKSPSAYREMRLDEKTGAGVLVLPSERTLRDYKHVIRPERGFNPAVIQDLASKTSNFQQKERFISLIFDEMKVQENLVWNKNSGELIGFVDLGDTDLNYASLKNVQELASHILVFMIKSIVNPLSYSFATFLTIGATSFQIFPLFWRAVAILDISCNLKVISSTADGASPNKIFVKMHKAFDGDCEHAVVHRSINPYGSVNPPQFLWFYSDPHHTMKTARNCLSKSGSSNSNGRMWNNGDKILWEHVKKIFDEQLENGIKLLLKLTTDHINLKSFSVMKVRLAVQILSNSVGKVLFEFGPPGAVATAKFCLMFDKYFDCLNVRNDVELKRKRKDDLKPYRSVTDCRFQWLNNEFLPYFYEWKSSIDKRIGNFDATSKNNMFLSQQTYESILMSVFSLQECVPFLLSNGVDYVLTERFCQDDLENYFGKQRAVGRRKDNPRVIAVGYNDNLIKSEFSIGPILGNVRANTQSFDATDDTPLPKRPRKTK